MNTDELKDRVDMLAGAWVNKTARYLSNEETKEAAACLIKDTLLFPKVVRSSNDPEILGQNIGLISFTPAKDVKPNKNGIYGVCKLRGNFATEEEASEKAGQLIKTVDSHNEIYHVRVGQVFPLTKSSKFVDDVAQVDISKEVDDTVKHDMLSKKKNDYNELKIIQEREKNLLKENKEIMDGDYKIDPFQDYVMKHVKKAQLVWTYLETKKKLDNEVMPSILKTRKEIKEFDAEFPNFKNEYYQHYLQSRKDVGINDFDKHDYSKFLKYILDEDVPEMFSTESNV